ncbi:hypothetical protein [Chlorogloeopsis fritschii]|nr:hypothetical protein [Chlorogloeopsis fritschii]
MREPDCSSSRYQVELGNEGILVQRSHSLGYWSISCLGKLSDIGLWTTK